MTGSLEIIFGKKKKSVLFLALFLAPSTLRDTLQTFNSYLLNKFKK